MANCQPAFLDYLKELNLTDTQFKKLQGSRDSLLGVVSADFKAKGRTVPAYESQGSYALDTINRPIADDYDLDHGIYLTHVADGTDLTVTTAFDLVSEAVKSLPLPPKDTCVRVQYKAAQDTPAHHIDLAIYRLFTNGIKKYAHKKKGWLDTDQKGFIELFKQRAGKVPQLRPTVRIFKGWSDYNGGKPGAVKFPSGFHFTVCAMECLVNHPDRLDQTLVYTAEKILGRLVAYLAVTGAPFKRPVTPYDDIFQDYDKARLSRIEQQFEHLVREGKRALAEVDPGKAQRIWKELLGERFPAPPAVKIEDAGSKWSGPAILGASDKAG